jgi:hypothetical protein
MEGAKGTYN